MQESSRQNNNHILEGVSVMSNDIGKMKETCGKIRHLLDEGTYKIDAMLNILNNLKAKEESIVASGGDQAVVQQLNEEQVDSILEMLKTPAFQNLARQLLKKWAQAGPPPASN